MAVRTLAGLAAGSLAGCAVLPPGFDVLGGGKHTDTVLTGYVGTVVADEPQAALTGRDVLAHGGNAADAATATALALSVTLPSRASLGGGGACIAARPGEAPQSFLFLPAAPQNAASSAPAGARPAAVPMTPRGLFLMQLRYGSVEFADTMQPAIALARNGITVSRAFGADLAAVHNALLADETARNTFTRAEDAVLQDGDALSQPQLANFLERISHVGVGDLYNGALGAIYAESASAAGGALDVAALRTALPAQVPSLQVTSGRNTAYFLPPPADGGYGAASMVRNGGSAQGAVAAWRAAHAAGGNSTDLVAAAQAALDSGARGNGALGALPASTSLVVTDRQGGAVACALTDGNLFGTGRVAPGTGVVIGASPAHGPQPLLGAAIVQSRGTLRGALASSGQNDAADALGAGTQAVLQDAALPHEGSGRLNAAVCRGGTCIGETDPRGTGLATGDDR
ncbi:gamma-glutamyltranspeptidase [Neoasaia chiangmaiensis NBRC 101099]|nr:gamma-glutamyltransferase [Neoasaia chiangmaiensis]GBR39839.1 gamma-glutamyltranspeptidase [Neoasaia chiangmaiensis NBRC 101099]GEN14765.1 gamma-glutamyltranspeptidase [Neoasaia chiangmaiensis]